jgi:negative regulator of sigma E activity
MGCTKIQEQLSAYLDGELTPDQAAAVETHLRVCVHCQEVFDELRLLISASQNLASASLKTDLWPAIQERVLTPEAPEKLRHRRPALLTGWRPRFAWALALACVVLILFVMRKEPRIPIPQNPPAPAQNQLAAEAEADLDLARQHYQRSAEVLETIIAHRSNDIDLDRALLYRQKLDQLEDVIAECSLALEKNRFDVHAQNTLFDAYDQKISTLREMALVAAH